MKKQLMRGAETAGKFAKSRPSETAWTIVGIVLGVFAGLSIGGVGIAMMGDAFGVSGLLLPFILAGVLGVVGSRVGMERDRRRDGIRLKALP